MKYYLLPIISVMTLAMSGLLHSEEEKPKVSICQKEESGLQDKVSCQLVETQEKIAELSHHNSTVLKNFELLSKLLDEAYHKEKSMTTHEVGQICAAAEFAAEKHRLQTRKDAEKTPYISHPLGVAYNLMSIGEVRDSAVIIGALLHDTVEDTKTTFEEIEKEFGKQVAEYVRELTDDRSLAQDTRKRLQIVSAAHKSLGASQIKLADNLYNLNDLFTNPPKEWSQARIDRYYEWSQSVIDRLPRANEKLLKAVSEQINTYWEKQSLQPKESS